MNVLSEALWGAYQLLASIVVDDAAREAHPELIERGFTKSWAESIRKDIEGPYKEAILKLILDNPVLSNTHAGFALGGARIFSGQSIRSILLAKTDLDLMVAHYEKGEGEDFEDPTIPLMKLGHSKEVAEIVADCGGRVIWSTANRKRYMRSLGHPQASRDTQTQENMRFKRGPAFLGVRPWVYDGVVCERQPTPTEEDVQFYIEHLNMWDDSDPLNGRWT